ncbi:MAG: DUF4345 domain-containing protein [Crocinitomicaceae bacterium]|nr:DUF4345 domain-containing protein [Crocinitomicaceae bacterium]
MPVGLKASFDVIIPNDANVLNDVRAFSMLTLAIGVFTILGAFKSKLTYAATLIVFVQFLALGMGRLISIPFDGMPIEGNIIGMSNEFFLGILGAILLFRYREKKQR